MKVYQWYDRLQEPWRFGSVLLFVIIVLPMISSDSHAINIIGALAVILVLGTRIYYINSSKNQNTP